ncbi:MAG: oligosaccharide flippase family protein [Planctomycetota bacterium]|nr:oligosaccharide flippase family protein [Planctomycetota bacterium]MCX8040106.1 oligosaccharide flippase family protein [Planctomycetota bacterium]MDW8372859.1 oligosaccharide flippase family protein [Planctomycetota bacterium]
MSLARPALAYLVASLLSGAATLALIPLLARHLGPEGYGQIGVFLSVLALGNAWIGWNIQGWALRRVQSGGEALAGLSVLVLAAIALPAALSALLLGACGQELAAYLGLPPWWLWLALLTCCAQAVLAYQATHWQAAERHRRNAVCSAAVVLAGVAATLVLIFVVGLGAEGRCLALALATAGAAALLSPSLFARGWGRPSWPAARAALLYGAPLVLHVCASWALLLADRTLVAAWLGSSEAGRYFAAAQLASVLTLGSDAINRAWVPWVYRRLQSARDEDRRAIVQRGRGLLALYAATAAALALLGQPLCAWILGPAYQGCGDLLAVLALAYAADAAYKVWVATLFFHERTAWVFAITGSAGAVALLAIGLAVPLAGALGAACGVALGTLLSALLAYLAAQRVHPLPWWRSAAR